MMSFLACCSCLGLAVAVAASLELNVFSAIISIVLRRQSGYTRLRRQTDGGGLFVGYIVDPSLLKAASSSGRTPIIRGHGWASAVVATEYIIQTVNTFRV